MRGRGREEGELQGREESGGKEESAKGKGIMWSRGDGKG